MTLEEAELIKNGANAYLALKISFANELAGLAERAGADIGPVLEAIGLDPRIGSSYMRPSFGFGGSCLPKELQTIAMSGLERGLPMHVTSAATEANLAQQRLFAERIDASVGGVAGRSIALLGLAFKAGTDDIRYSPAVGLARWLVDHGARVHAYDPGGRDPRRARSPGLDRPRHGRRRARRSGRGGDRHRVAGVQGPRLGAAPASTMAAPLIIDGRRLLDPITMEGLGFVYERVGSPPVRPASVDGVTVLAPNS